MKNGMRVIDCEHRFDFDLMLQEWKKSMSPEQWKLCGGDMFDNPSEQVKQVFAIVEDIDELRLKVMDQCGIDFAQVSLTTPGAEYFGPEVGKKIAKEYNDIIDMVITSLIFLEQINY